MSRARLIAAALLPLLAAGCLATKRDLQDLRTEMQAQRSSEEAMLRDVLRRMEAMMDSLGDQEVRTRGDFNNRLSAIERQLVQIQELTGQGQRQLNQLREEIARRDEEARRQAAAEAAARRDSAAGGDGGGDAVNPQETYDAALAALRRGSAAAARAGFEEFLEAAPGHRLAADAQFYIGESYATGRDPARAVTAFERVVELYPTSARAPAALLRIGRIELERGNRTAARTRFNRVVSAYPRSPEAAEAQRELTRLRS